VQQEGVLQRSVCLLLPLLLAALFNDLFGFELLNALVVIASAGEAKGGIGSEASKHHLTSKLRVHGLLLLRYAHQRSSQKKVDHA
jgi:hypothetical protein